MLERPASALHMAHNDHEVWMSGERNEGWDGGSKGLCSGVDVYYSYRR
ncbi:MAG: hypothetical protein PHQ23_08395 [Candidatus Wallbacteria bacterium]|nr:hypothetical protein [Candidatus Wallbacteria bacterium]